MRLAALALSLALSSSALALTPAEIIVVANKGVPQSVELGEYYLKARGVPKENLLSLLMPRGEEMTRVEYEKWLMKPLREALAERKDKVKCILLMYGVPIRVAAKVPNDDEKAEGERLKAIYTKAKAEAKTDAEKAKLPVLDLNWKASMFIESTASVDSELMLLWWDDYPLARFVLNPLHWQAPERYTRGRPPVLMTARLDGPSTTIVRRLIDDAIAVEAVGLEGKVYVDARDIAFDPKKPNDSSGYGGYDESMREMAEMFKATKFKVVLDNKPEVFAPMTCTDVALYCGWYSHGKYVDSFSFNRGAVAWHLASSEAITLRKSDSPVWCPNLLKHGVAATIGPVAEPYAVAFPKPAEFFGFLATGKYTLAEVYSRTTNLASWMMLCVGDPLYNPFGKTKLLQPSDVFPSPKGSASIFPK